MKKTFFCFFYFLQSILYGGPILKVSSFDELPRVFAKLNPLQTFVFLDVDDLVLSPKSSLGSVSWFKEMKNMLLQHDLTDEQSSYVRSEVWDFGLRHTSFYPPSESLMDALRYLKSREFPILGVTRRSISFASTLPLYLSSIGCDFASVLPSFLRISHFLSAKDPKSAWTQGVLFVGPLSISEAIERFVLNVSIPVRSTVCISLDSEFLNECHNFFSKKKTSNISLLLKAESKSDERMEDAEAQLLSLTLSPTDEEIRQTQKFDISHTRKDILKKMRDIWNLCSG
ncbi:DUF2608 domain-containing protein [Candidatus Similichlamydia epinepheli]|uniref:DUF2608 domain-containing protein n=1 Tax=Candidatus Similichlamydia epinepheli TaxID=1903953 RepID=UPI000D3BE3CB|nr:DUF2608 domain-containing protein [Candidatus Similichlamydia epinepheli]